MPFEPFLAYEASAGSGKTFNLVVRYLSLLFMGEDPRSIAALTFTNKAANEMLERIIVTLQHLEERGELAVIAQVCGLEIEEILDRRDRVLKRFLSSDIQISTIDKFFGRILRKFALNAGLMPTFVTTQNHHDVQLIERFLNEVETSGNEERLVHLALIGIKRLSDLFKLLSALYGKYKEIDMDAFETADVPLERIEDVMRLAYELRQLVQDKELSVTAKKAVDVETFEELLSKTWLFQPTLNYWVFKKGFEPRMDVLLREMQTIVREYFQRREILYFRELFGILKIYIKSRRDMALHNNELTFDDITLMVHTLLREKIDSEFLYFRLDSDLKHLLLDEFQDTSVIQFDILRPLIEEIRSGEGTNRGGSFFFVGDVKQSIYRFRGGVSALFHEVAELFDVHIEPLRTNYRSEKEIVDFVNRSFEPKMTGYIRQLSREECGGYVCVRITAELLESLAATIARLLDHGAAITEIAVLTVTNSDGSAVEEHLSALGYDVVTETTAKLIAQRNVRAIIEYLRYCYFGEIIYKVNCAALLGVETEAILKTDVLSLTETAVAFVQKFGIADKNTLLFLETLHGYRDVQEVAYTIERLETAAAQSERKGIRIMTVHKSKGLEFEHVIVLDQLGKGRSGNDPIVYAYEGTRLERVFYRIKEREKIDEIYAKALASEQKAREEDQLNALYVALTRAVSTLHVIGKEKNSWLAPLELSEGEFGLFGDLSTGIFESGVELPAVAFHGERYGRQEEPVAGKEKEEIDFAAAQFGTALHYTLELMGEFDSDSLSTAIESTRNRYGGVLYDDGIEEIRRRIERLLRDESFINRTRGKRHKEQPMRYNGALYVIDLLIHHDSGWTVIDYKSGKEGYESHSTQVKQYVDAVRELTGENVEGYLCYLLGEGIEWRKCL